MTLSSGPAGYTLSGSGRDIRPKTRLSVELEKCLIAEGGYAWPPHLHAAAMSCDSDLDTCNRCLFPMIQCSAGTPQKAAWKRRG